MGDLIYDTAIVGGGIAGFEAALTLRSLKRNFLWLGAEKFGEKLSAAEAVRNFPSFSGRGAELKALLSAQAEREGIAFTRARIDGIYATGGGFALTQGKETFSARTVILATGVETRGDLKGEREFFGRGVSYCAVCDGALYRGKRVAAVLYSAEFAEEAEYLAGFAEKVYCFCLCPPPAFRAPNIERVTAPPVAVEGGLRTERVVTAEGEFAVDGVFFLKESAPPSVLVPGLAEEDGHVRVGRDMSTNLKGLFAAGDVTGRPYQYVKAAGEGCVAAYSAHAFLLRGTGERS